jgi:hypothetical protein
VHQIDGACQEANCSKLSDLGSQKSSLRSMPLKISHFVRTRTAGILLQTGRIPCCNELPQLVYADGRRTWCPRKRVKIREPHPDPPLLGEGSLTLMLACSGRRPHPDAHLLGEGSLTLMLACKVWELVQPGATPSPVWGGKPYTDAHLPGVGTRAAGATPSPVWGGLGWGSSSDCTEIVRDTAAEGGLGGQRSAKITFDLRLTKGKRRGRGVARIPDMELVFAGVWHWMRSKREPSLVFD